MLRALIHFEIQSKRRLAPFVSPVLEGKYVESLGYETNTFVPAYIKDRRTINPQKQLRRIAGERIGGGGLSASARESANIAVELQDQSEMLTRRLELMAAEVLTTASATIVGDGVNVSIDYGRDAAHEVALTTTARWGETDVEPMDNIETWQTVVLKATGRAVTDVIMEPDAWTLFGDSPKVQRFLDTRRETDGPGLGRARPTGEGIQFKGTIGEIRYHIYQQWYHDGTDDVPFLPQYQVIMGSQELLGTRHFGAIQDQELNFGASAFASKSWTVPDPSQRFLLMQSAPLVVPYRPDATFAALVHDGV